MNTTEELKGKLKDIKHQLYLEKRAKHHSFVAEHKFILRVFDTLFVLSLLCNFGALFMTEWITTQEDVRNAIVNDKPLIYHETNPVNPSKFSEPTTEQGKADAKRHFSLLIQNSVFWAVLIGLYIFQRSKISTNIDLYWMIFTMCIFYYLIVADFVGDLGIIMRIFTYG